MAFCRAVSSEAAACSRPRERRTPVSASCWVRSLLVGFSGVSGRGAVGGVGRAWRGGRFWGGLGEEGIVGLEIVGCDIEVVGGVVSGDDGLGRLTEAAGKAAMVDEGAHVGGAEGAGSEGLGHAAGDFRFAVPGHQAMELLDLALEVDGPTGDFLQVHASLGGEAGDAILAGDRERPLALVGGDLLDVRGVLDGASSVEAAIVAGGLGTVWRGTRRGGA